MEKINNILGNEISGNESINTRLSAIDRNFDILKPLQQNINLYVSQSGDDVNGDGSEAKPFRSIQKALDILPKNLGGYNVVIHVASGAYNGGFSATFFYNGLIEISGEAENKPVINGDCFINAVRLRAIQMIYLEINGSKINTTDFGVINVANTINCGIYETIIDGIDKTEDGLRVDSQSNVGVSSCTINNCKVAVSTSANSGTRGIATASLYETKGVNNSIGINSVFAVVGLYSTSIEADTQYYKRGGIIINSDGNLA